MRKIAFMIAAAAMAAASSSAIAAQANDGFQVKVQINKRCSVTMPDIDFGTLDATVAATTANADATISCSKGAAYNLGLTNATTAPFVTSVSGTMAGATPGNTDTIPYDLSITSGASGTGTGLGVAQQQTATLEAELTADDDTLTPDSYAANRTLYINY